MVLPIITIEESDTYNTSSTDWLELSDTEKTLHIFYASLYIQTKWTCLEIDWEDLTTVPDDIKRACAYYADADRLKLLYSPMTADYAKGRLVEQTNGMDPFVETLKWAAIGPDYSGKPLERIDAIMSTACTKTGYGQLVRV